MVGASTELPDVCVYFRVQMLDLSVGNSSSSGVLYKLPAHLTPRMDQHVSPGSEGQTRSTDSE